ncbi:MAG: hypothetical protein NZL83_04155 [Candidatus Absconditabacterales bacterium]|nr:hypothetical protein [Candidatus Absconditabacterales bacterium]
MNQQPTAPQTPSHTRPSIVSLPKRGYIGIGLVMMLIIGLGIWRMMRPSPFELVSFSHVSNSPILLSSNPTLTFSFSHHLSNPDAIIIEPSNAVSVSHQGSHLTMTLNDIVLRDAQSLTITFPTTLKDTAGRHLSQDLVFFYSVFDFLEVTNIPSTPLAIGQARTVTFSHPVPDNTCPISFQPTIQGKCKKTSAFSYSFEPLWIGHDSYSYTIGFDTQTTGTIPATLPTQPTITTSDSAIVISLPTELDSQTIHNNLSVTSGSTPVAFTVSSENNLVHTLALTDVTPGTQVTVTLNEIPLGNGNEVMPGVSSSLPTPSLIQTIKQDRDGRGWMEELCVTSNLRQRQSTQDEQYQQSYTYSDFCSTDLIIDRPLTIQIHPSNITDIVLSDGSKTYWKSSDIQETMMIPLQSINISQATKLSISLVANGKIVQTINLPITPQKAHITTVENVNDMVCLYSSHRLRRDYRHQSLTVIFSNPKHTTQTDFGYEGCPSKDGLVGYLIQTKMRPNTDYSVSFSGTVKTELGYSVQIPTKKLSLTSPGLQDSDRSVSRNYPYTSTFPSHQDLRVRWTATNSTESWVHYCIKEFDPNRQRSWDGYQFGESNDPCKNPVSVRISSSGAQEPNWHKPMLHSFVITTDKRKGLTNPEIWVTVSLKETRKSTDQWSRFVPTSLSVFVEANSNQTLWFVTDWEGNPATNLNIRDAKTNEPITLTPKKQGVRTSGPLANLWQSPFIISADQGNTILDGNTHTMDQWQLNLGRSPDTSYEDTFVYIYTDRPLYKPNDEIFVKGIARAYGPKGYTLLPKGTRGTLSLIHKAGDGEPIWQGQITLDTLSSFSSRIRLNNAKHGKYMWELTLNERNESRMRVGPSYVHITDYVKPNFEVTTTLPSQLIGHQTLNLTGFARFYHGLNLTNAPVSINVIRQEIDFLPKGYDEYSFGDPSRYWYCWAWQGCANDPDFVPGFEMLTTRTNTNGQFSQRLDLSQTNPATGKIYLYGVSASVTDPFNGETVIGNAETIVYPSTTFFGIKAPRWVEGSRVSFSAIALDTNHKPKPNTTITAQLARTRGTYGYKQSLDGNRYYSWDIKTEVVQTEKLTTNDQGTISHAFTLPANGDEWSITLSDPNNPQTPVTSHRFWRWTNNNQTFSNTSVIELITDKKAYKPGDTAQISLRAPIDKGALLVLIQRDEEILDQWVEPLTQFGHQIKLPIKNTYGPNVYVKIALIGTDKDLDYPIYRRGATNLKIDSSDKRLTVTVSTDKQTYKPKDTIQTTIRVTNTQGQPVANADVSVAIVDMSLLALKGNPKKNPYAFFWNVARPLNTMTLRSVTNLLDANILLSQDDGEKGGDGILGEVDPNRVRGDFRDTARWQASATTNAQGILTITTPPLPDNLTQRQIEAIVHTNQTQLGAGYHVFFSKQDISVIDNLPNIFVSADNLVIQPSIINSTNKPKTLTIEFSGYNLQALGDVTQTVTVPANDRTTLSFPVKIRRLTTHEPARSRVQFLVKEGKNVIDAVQRDIPLLPHHAALTRNHNGNAQSLDVTTPSHHGFTQITVSTNPLASIMHLIRSNEVNIYGCLEQKSSAVFPHFVRARILKAWGKGAYFSFDPKDESSTTRLSYNETKKIQDFFNNLGQYQQEDGGMIYWLEYESESDLRLSALVKSLIRQGKELGFTITGIDTKKLDNYLITTWKNISTDGNYGTTWSARSPRFDARVVGELMILDPSLVHSALPKTISSPDDLMRRLASKPKDSKTAISLINQGLESNDYWYRGIWASQVLGYLAQNTTLWNETRVIHSKLMNMILSDTKDPLNRSTWMITELLLHLEPYIIKLAQENTQSAFFSLNGKRYELGTGTRGKELTMSLPWTKTGEQLRFDFGDKGKLYYLVQMTQYVEPLSLKPIVRGYAIEQTYYNYADIMARYRKTPENLQTLERLKQDITPLTGTIIQGTRVAILTHISNPANERRHVALDSFIPGGFVLSNPKFVTSEKIPDILCKRLFGQEQNRWYANPCQPWNVTEYHDSKFFAYNAYLNAGEYFFLTLATARHPGTFVIKPATVFSFYEPQQRGQTQGQTITIKAK